MVLITCKILYKPCEALCRKYLHVFIKTNTEHGMFLCIRLLQDPPILIRALVRKVSESRYAPMTLTDVSVLLL